jgi:DNA-binding CsgD family transcriptional regulator
VVLLRGEAGVGKTAVLARFLAGRAQPARVVRGWCDPLGAPRPLGPLIDMLADLSDEHAAGVRAAIAAGDTEAIYARLVGMFGDGQAWVCVIEDAHWADGATLDLLRFLARRIDLLPVLLVVSYRDDELGDQHPLAVTLGDLATCAAVSRIRVAPLSPAAVASLAAGSGINAEQLHQLTGGNPFFVSEVLAAGPDALNGGSLPRSVSEAVWGRLARLSAAGRGTARAAAVCARQASPTLVAAVCAPAAVALTECLHAGVLVADADTIGFRHELARRATVEQIPEYERRVLHKRALTVLSQPPIDPNNLAALVFHADQAGDTDAVIQHGPAAAQRATILGAHRQAADLYALVLRHADSITDRQKVVWLEQYAFESFLCGQLATAVPCCREAIALRHKLGDRLAEGDDLRWLSHVLWPLGRTSEALQAAVESARLLDEVGPSAESAWSLVHLAVMSVSRYDSAAFEYAARAIVLGTQLGDPAVVAAARGYAALAAVVCGDTGWDELEIAWREAMRTAGLLQHAGALGFSMCMTAVVRAHLDRAEGYLAEVTTLCDQHDLGMYGALVSGAGALAGLYRGDWTRAEATAHELLTRPGLSPLHRILPLMTLGLLRARRGDQHVAPLLDEALSSAGSDDGFWRLLVWAGRAEAAWLAGDDDGVRAEAQAGLAAASEHADPWLVWQLRRWAHLPGAQPTGQPVDDPANPFQLEVSGDWQAAAQAWMRRGCLYESAIAQLGGDAPSAEAALATFRCLGARAAARRAQQQLAQLRGRDPDLRRKATSADPYGLTQRERDVLELLADGHTDAEIGAALYISPKTANRHVGAILAKLGVHNRTQAAAYAHRDGPAPSARNSRPNMG